jgi:circadian clock protein KaiC
MTDDRSAVELSPAPPRVPTGVRGLDALLGGGLTEGATYLLMGRPGAGKTTLGNQLAFAHVHRGGRAVYMTLLAESHATMLRNLSSMSFFDAGVINDGITYVGAYRALRDDKLRGLLGIVRQVIRDERATLLVIDGASPARAHSESDVALKEFILELQVLGAMTGCTTVLLSNMTAEDANGPEHTMVDGLIELGFERSHRRTVRTIEVLKLRGSKHLLGRQEMTIGEAGIEVYPRLEDLDEHAAHCPQRTRGIAATGVVHLDEMLGGGLPTGTTSVVLGFTGSGKTTLGAHFLHAGASNGEPGLYFGFYEAPARLLDAAEGIGIPLREHVANGLVSTIWQPPYAKGLDALADAMFADVATRGVRRIVVDGLDGFRQAAIQPERTIRFLTALSNELRALDVTTVITEETAQMSGPGIGMRVEGTSALVDTIIMLEYLNAGSEQRRLISVLKARGVAHATRMREMHLGSAGMVVSADSTSADRILSGSAGALTVRGRPQSFGGD